MEQLDIIGIMLTLCLLNTLVIDWSSASAIQEDHIGGQGLYNASDDVVILNATNLKANIYGSTKSWLVEFYNSWCGFCFRFAPTWKALASDILSWNDIVVIAALDCADDENNPFCREYEIMHYPMLKYFAVNAHPQSLGIIIEKGNDLESLRHNLINTLEIEQQEGRGSTWPNIAPYRNVEISDIWKTTSSNVKHFFLIFENIDSYLGAEVSLDLHRINSIQIRRVTSDNELLCVVNKVTKFPTLIAFSRNESQKVINIKTPTREEIRKTIKDYVIARGENIDDTITTIPHNTPNENAHRITTVSTAKFNEEEHPPKKIEDYVYQLDLENTLRYSINHEVSLSKSIDGEKIEALRKYLSILAAYFPSRRNSGYLERIRDIIKSKTSITGKELKQLARRTEEKLSPIYSGSHQWIGCKGSTNLYRGYPCGLWTMFHMLTVNYALEKRAASRSSVEDPAAVLRAIYSYIDNFFGCADCAAHFVEMANRNKIFEVRTKDEGVLWLWRAHNEVNARLSGDETEDPEHKKIQYPSAEHCAACRFANGSWNENEVLRYLKIKYSYSGIKYDRINDNDDSITDDNVSRIKSEKFLKERKRIAFGWDFNIFDISICVVLYIISATILVLVCVKFAVKRTYKKKAQINLLSKI